MHTSPDVSLEVVVFLLGSVDGFAQLRRLATNCDGACGDMRSAPPWLTEPLPSPDRFDGGGVPAAAVGGCSGGAAEAIGWRTAALAPPLLMRVGAPDPARHCGERCLRRGFSSARS